MKLFRFLVLTMLVGVLNSTDTCYSEPRGCPAPRNYKYLFFEVSSQEGFNLRRDVYMRYAIMFSEMRKRGRRLHWKLVLPPFYRMPHWRHENPSSEPVPWGSLFDLDSLRSYVPVVELKEIFNDTSDSLYFDRELVLLNYENPFVNGKFEEKWKIVHKCDQESLFYWGYNADAYESVCVKYQGKVSKIWNVILQHPHDRSVVIYHAEIPLHDSYGTKSYWDCRKSMKFNQELVGVASNYIKQHFRCWTDICDTYLSVHWRRGDYVFSRKNDIPSIKGAAKQIDKAMLKNKLNTTNVFIATDGDFKEKHQLNEALQELGYTTFFYLPTDKELAKFRDGGIAIIDQIICSRAAYFIGSHESTFSYRIQEEREILGYDAKTTFNRLCPDVGACEPSSIWKIIH